MNLEFRSEKTSATALKGGFKASGALFPAGVAALRLASIVSFPLPAATATRRAVATSVSARDGSILVSLTAS
jgi:hypothetical protein